MRGSHRILACAIAVLALLDAGGPALAAQSSSHARPLLSGMFTDHAVVQRGRPVPVWGHAAPGAGVNVSFAGQSVQTKANDDGIWHVSLRAMKAGGPYTLGVRSGAQSQTARDVLVGDVYLCSGQSNMELPVRRTLDSDSEIDAADNDRIRMITIAKVATPTPLADFSAPASWQPTTPQTVPDFSATCYYFARELQKTVDVPIGLVNASWGGSKIRTWISQDALRATGLFNDQLDILKAYAADPADGAKRFGALWESWWKDHRPSGADAAPWRADLDARDWKIAPAGLGRWDSWGIPALVDHTGMVWFRTHVNVSAAQAAKPAVLSIGAVDEVDATWVNGTFVGAGSGGDRTYGVPKGVLHAGDNVIAVNVLNTYKMGGLVGPPSAQMLHFDGGENVLLTAHWKYRIMPSDLDDPPRAPWEPLAGLGMAYNGMIAPMGDYAYRGTLWYQGESDTGDTASYKKLLTGLLADWREKFGADLPFLIVQLPGYGAPPVKPGPSGWADIREAERAVAASDKNAALAVTIDIGNEYDVHPGNKQELGRRLTRAALHLIYGKDNVPGGPAAIDARRTGNGIVVHFKNAEGGLVTYSSNMPIGFELCGNGEDTCRYVSARIGGDAVTLPEAGDATHVRYCWADAPVCTLFDGAGLPAGPFDLPVGGTRAASSN